MGRLGCLWMPCKRRPTVGYVGPTTTDILGMNYRSKTIRPKRNQVRAHVGFGLCDCLSISNLLDPIPLHCDGLHNNAISDGKPYNRLTHVANACAFLLGQLPQKATGTGSRPFEDNDSFATARPKSVDHGQTCRPGKRKPCSENVAILRAVCLGEGNVT